MRICELTGKVSQRGRSRSKSMVSTPRTFRLNLHSKRFAFFGRRVSLRLSPRALKLIKDLTLEDFLLKFSRYKDRWSSKVQKLFKEIQRKRDADPYTGGN